MPAPKGSSREAQRCLCAGQISHVSLLQHTDRSSQYSLLHEGQVHACRAEREKEGGRKRVEEWERSYNPNSFFPFSFHTFSLSHVSRVFPSLSPFINSPFSLPLSAEESSLSIGIEALWRWSRTVPLAASTLLPLLPTYHPTLPAAPVYPPPSAPTPQPSGGLDPAQLRETMLQIPAWA